MREIERTMSEYNAYAKLKSNTTANSYAEYVLLKEPYKYLYEYPRQISDKYLGNDDNEYYRFKDELQYHIYPDLRQALIDYMNGDTDEISLELSKCVIQDVVHRAFTSTDEDNAPAWVDELDNMDYGDEDNFEYISIDNPAFINYDPSYYIPTYIFKFEDLYLHM